MDGAIKIAPFSIVNYLKKCKILLEYIFGDFNMREPRCNNIVPSKNLWEIAIDFLGKIDIQCKYSKPDSNEMSIYFVSTHINGFQIEPGDYWYVYFRSGENNPYIGVLSKYVWESWFKTHRGKFEATICP